MESTSSGLIAGINASREHLNKEKIIFKNDTQIGALANYVSSYAGNDFQPMGANFGIMHFDVESVYGRVKDKKLKKLYTAENALNRVKEIVNGGV